jgi:hypothetical protein
MLVCVSLPYVYDRMKMYLCRHFGEHKRAAMSSRGGKIGGRYPDAKESTGIGARLVRRATILQQLDAGQKVAQMAANVGSSKDGTSPCPGVMKKKDWSRQCTNLRRGVAEQKLNLCEFAATSMVGVGATGNYSIFTSITEKDRSDGLSG